MPGCRSSASCQRAPRLGVNHSWHVALQVVPRGFRTYVLPAGEADYELLFDVVAEEVTLFASDGRSARFAVKGQTVKRFTEELTEALAAVGAEAPLSGGPNEVEEAVPFAEDERPRSWDPEVARRLHRAFLSVDGVFREFRSGFIGKSSPSHLFWGSFDLAVTRFSGRRAPRHPGGFPNLSDRVTREAYSHELVSAGFWPGGGGRRGGGLLHLHLSRRGRLFRGACAARSGQLA